MNTKLIDRYIVVIADFLSRNFTEEAIVEQCRENDLESDNIYLLIQAAKLLLQDRKLAKPKAKTFTRKL